MITTLTIRDVSVKVVIVAKPLNVVASLHVKPFICVYFFVEAEWHIKDGWIRFSHGLEWVAFQMQENYD